MEWAQFAPFLRGGNCHPEKPNHLPTDTEMLNGRARLLTTRRDRTLNHEYFLSILMLTPTEKIWKLLKDPEITTGSLRASFGLRVLFG